MIALPQFPINSRKQNIMAVSMSWDMGPEKALLQQPVGHTGFKLPTVTVASTHVIQTYANTVYKDIHIYMHEKCDTLHHKQLDD